MSRPENIKNICIVLWIFFIFCFIFPPLCAKAISDTIQINEVYYDVGADKGTESEGEWVELYNAGATDINLKDWTIKDNLSDDLLSATELIIAPKDFVLIAKSNSIWSDWQIDPATLPSNLHLVELGSNLGNGLGNSGDRLRLYDENGILIDEIIWGSAASEVPLVPEGHSLERTALGVDTDTISDFVDRLTPTPGVEYVKKSYYNDIKISELVPEPDNGAENEYIELYNGGAVNRDISGWQIKDKEGAIKTFTIPATPETKSLEPGKFLVFYQNETKLSLNDDGDGIILLDPNGEIRDERSYDKSIRGMSFAMFNNGWAWSKTLTPKTENVLTENTVLMSAEKGVGESGTINEAKNNNNDETVRVTGQVTTLPGEISGQYFFIQDETGGIEVYSYYKNFPELRRGDKISVTGKLSDYYGTRRIKTSLSTDITVLESAELPAPIALTVPEIGENQESRYVKTQGRVSYTSGATFRIIDGDREITVEIKTGTGIKKPKMRKGDLVEVAGIVVQYKSGYKILPFLPENVKIIRSNSDLLPESGSNQSITLIISIIIFAIWNIYREVKMKLSGLPR